jgi:prophage tail gpP-like protein
MPVNNYTDLGGTDDRIKLFVDGEQVKICTRYSLKRGILVQPSTFSMTLGSGDLARELLGKFRPGLEVALTIGNTGVFSGVLEDPSAGGSEATEVTIEGRDWLAPLAKTDVIDEIQFGSPTYFELVKEVMKLVGYENTQLIAGNDANRSSTSRIAAKAKPAAQVVESIETGTKPGNLGAKIQYNTIKCEIGQSWFDFLVSQLKKVGLYLWCSGEGDLILAKPTAAMGPIYQIKRYRGIPRTMGSVISGTITNRTSGRHAWCRVYGKGGPDKNGRRANFGDWPDQEMIVLGYQNWRVIYDNDCATWREGQYIAKRTLAEERRQNRTLTYTLAGHTVPSLAEPDVMAIWTPDTVVRVDDDELAFPGEEKTGIHENLYVESVEMSRGPQTQTVVHLMREHDLKYLGEDTDNEGKDAPIPAAPKVKRKKR